MAGLSVKIEARLNDRFVSKIIDQDETQGI
jgi:hypothetical protein